MAADLVGLGAAMAAAAIVRWPNLWLIPTFTDETLEARLAIQIYRGQAAPLTNVDPYIGALWNYLLAAGFELFGLSPWLPRLLAFVAGVASVGATWWLGRELGGRLGGMVAAGFLAANATHILVNSHVGWSHSTTPLFTTLGFACLARVSRLSLVGAGAMLGLGVQTHLTAALLLPGAVGLFLAQRPELLRTRWSVLALGAFLLVTANVVVYNVATGGQSLAAGQRIAAEYTGEDVGYDSSGYAENLDRLALGGSWVLSGAIEKRRFIGESLASPLPLLYLALGIASLAWAGRRGRWLPMAATLPYVLVLPLLNPKYEPLLNGRYLTPLLPLVYAGMGLVVGDAWRTLKAGWPQWAPALGFFGLAGVAILMAYPLLPLARYERSTERTNHAVFAAYQTVVANREPGETVLLDYGLDSVFYMAAGSAYKSMELLLATGDIPYVVVDARPSSIGDALAERSPRLALLQSDKVPSLGRTFTLTPLGDVGRGPGFGVYRVGVRGRT